MKKAFIFVAGFLWMAAAIAQTVPQASTDHNFVGSWTAPLNQAGTAPGANCSTYGGTATVSCIKGYTVTIVTPPGVPGPAPIVTNCASGATTNCLKPGDTGFTWTPGGPLYCGNWSYTLVANWLDDSGNASNSVSVTSPLASAACPPFVASPATAPTASVN